MSTRNADEDFAMLFSSVFAFSKHLVKWEDNRMRDKCGINMTAIAFVFRAALIA